MAIAGSRIEKSPLRDPIFILALILILLFTIDIFLVMNGSCISRILGIDENCGY
jgi:hypothetical protein